MRPARAAFDALVDFFAIFFEVFKFAHGFLYPVWIFYAMNLTYFTFEMCLKYEEWVAFMCKEVIIKHFIGQELGRCKTD